jgi:predicted ArsR family transcriptional regulator
MALSQPASQPQLPRSASDRLLLILKMHGPQSSAVLGAKLGISGEAARQQLLRLEEQGLVESRPVVRGVGRPLAMWHLTTAAERRFPDAHAQLTVDLLAVIRSELGQSALDQIITAREAETRATYNRLLEQETTVSGRVARLAEIRSEEGYMAEVEESASGYLLVENHCPICAAATSCQDFCRAELNVFQDVLGPEVTVERTEHIPHGARRCAYRITKATEK